MMKFNLGCGSVRQNGWINSDSLLSENSQRVPIIGKSIAKIIRSEFYETKNLIFMNINNNCKFEASSLDVEYAYHLHEYLRYKFDDLF